MEKKEKTITIDLASARKLWDGVKNAHERTSAVEMELRDLLQSKFTPEELNNIKEGFTWEESFQPGYAIYNENGSRRFIDPIVKACYNPKAQDHFKVQFRTSLQAESALAFAQLSHIVAKYNEGKRFETKYWFVIDNLVVLNLENNYHELGFCTREDAEISLRVNRELWESYWMVDKVSAKIVETDINFRNIKK